MPRRRIKVEFEDSDGGKYTLALSGALSRDKVLRLIDMVQLMDNSEHNEETSFKSSDTTFSKLYQLLEKRFPLGNFTSTDLLEAYEDEYQQPIKLSTISTYLSRFTDRGILARQRISSGWSYKRVRISTPNSR